MSVAAIPMRPPFVVFLDIDGVLFGEIDMESFYKKARELVPNFDRKNKQHVALVTAHFLNPQALRHLRCLTREMKKTHSIFFVIASNWRKGFSVKQLKEEVFGHLWISKYIFDKTVDELPDQWIKAFCAAREHDKCCRAAEIGFWLSMHRTIKQFAVLDDQDSHLRQKFEANFFQCTHSRLLTRAICNQVLAQNQFDSELEAKESV